MNASRLKSLFASARSTPIVRPPADFAADVLRALPPRGPRREPESVLALLAQWFRPLALAAACLLALCLGGEAWLTWRHGGPAAAVERAATAWLLTPNP